MPISFPTSLPNPSQISLEIVSNTQISKSVFTKEVQVAELLGTHWAFSANWDIILPEQIPAFRAFLSKLRGGAVQFYYSDISAPTPNGDISTTLTIVSAPTINTLSVTCSQLNTTILKAGDYIEVPTDTGENELKMVEDDVLTDGAGAAIININPHMRNIATVGGSIVYDNPKGVFMVDTKKQKWTITAPLNGQGFSISAFEWLA